MSSFYPPPYRPPSSERPRVSSRPAQAPAKARSSRVRTVQPQGLSETTPSINMTHLIDVVLVLWLLLMAVSPRPTSFL